MTPTPRRFRYAADPVCVVSVILYAINRYLLKPHHIGGWFTHGYFNDVLCLPLFVPLILLAQRMVLVRRHDGYPRWWEILQHFVIFSIVFQVVLPRFPGAFTSAGDPYDMLAYLMGGILAGAYWAIAERGSVRRDRDLKINV